MQISLRAAVLDDVPALLAVLGDEPSDEQLGMANGDARRARAFRALLNQRLTAPQALVRTTVAVSNGSVSGLLQTGAELGEQITLALVANVIRIFGVHVLSFARRDRARAKVHIPAPAGAFHIAEVHVRSDLRNGGIGRTLMMEAERAARAAGASVMSLTTTTSNPARRLYERCGFEVVETRTDQEYERYTGVAGRVLMLKRLGAQR
jgi:ribosomal protein S18 acetylase RimI-like enzyme